MTARPIIVHCLDDAEAALTVAGELGVAVTLRNAPGAHRTLGATVFRDMIAAARARHEAVAVRAVFDCGADPGAALAALRHGLDVVRVDLDAETRTRVADIARQTGASIENAKGDGDSAALDLLDVDDRETAVREWLAGTE